MIAYGIPIDYLKITILFASTFDLFATGTFEKEETSELGQYDGNTSSKSAD